MAEIVTKNSVCPVCDTEVRAGAAFCYHCGGAVAPEPFPTEINAGSDSAKTILRSDKAENQNGHEIISDSLTAENVEKIPDESDKKTKLVSAAKMRRRPKKFQQKRVEISWEQPSGASGALFIIAVVLLVALAVGIWFLAGYLK